MITITTNTRGSTKMPKIVKDYADMTAGELVEAYNAKSGKDPIKKFRDRATALARLAALDNEKSQAKAATAKPEKNGKGESEQESGGGNISENKLAAEFKARIGSFREKLLIALDNSFGKQVPVAELLKEVYGSKNVDNVGALGMVIKGAMATIKKNKLPYELKKEKNEAKEVSYGMHNAE